MSDVEHRVRDLLRRHADDAPPGVSLLTAVRTESRRRTRRTRVLVAAVVIVLAGVGATLPLRLAVAPVTVAAPSTLAEPTGPATVTFPLSPSSVDPTEVRLEAGVPTLSHPMPGAAATATLTVGPTRPGVLAAATGTEPVEVRGHEGQAVEWTGEDGEPELSLVWQEHDGQWFELRAVPRVPVDHLAGFAKSLLAVPVTAPAPFTFAAVPAGYTVDNISAAAVTFCPPDTAFDQSFTGKITVMLGGTDEQPPGRAVDVGGHPATLTSSPDGFIGLHVDLGDGRLLVVQSAVRTPLPEPDLIRFAAGITVMPSAVPGKG